MKALTGSVLAAAIATVLSAGARVPDASRLSQTQEAVVESLLQAARGQIAIAEYAREHAKRPSVRRLADVVLSEWSSLAERLAPIAAANDEPVATALTSTQMRMFEELRQTSMEDFDAAYVRVAHTDFERALQLFAGEDGAGNPQLGAALRDVQPRFRHLEEETSVDPAPSTLHL